MSRNRERGDKSLFRTTIVMMVLGSIKFAGEVVGRSISPNPERGDKSVFLMASGALVAAGAQITIVMRSDGRSVLTPIVMLVRVQ